MTIPGTGGKKLIPLTKDIQCTIQDWLGGQSLTKGENGPAEKARSNFLMKYT